MGRKLKTSTFHSIMRRELKDYKQTAEKVKRSFSVSFVEISAVFRNSRSSFWWRKQAVLSELSSEWMDAYLHIPDAKTFSETLHIVIYTLIIYPSSENSVTATFPSRDQGWHLKVCVQTLRKVNIFRSPRLISKLYIRSDYAQAFFLNQLNYPGDRGDTKIFI